MNSEWVNVKKLLKKNSKKEKPCHLLGYCPYGGIVEMFPLEDLEVEGQKVNCETFGHHCPMFYNAEDIKE